MKRLLVLFALSAAGGCVTRYSLAPEHFKGLRYAEGGGEIVEHYQIHNYGWYLFNCIPLVCGDTDPDAKLCFSLFSDQVRTDLLINEFNRRVRETGTRPVSVATRDSDLVAFELPGISFQLIIPYIVCYREVQVSGLLVRDGTCPVVAEPRDVQPERPAPPPKPKAHRRKVIRHGRR